MRLSKCLAGLAMLSLLAVVLIGCGGKPTQANYDKVQNGMTVSQVEGLLGPGAKQAGGMLGGLTGDVYQWKTPDSKTISVTFKDGKVVTKVMM